MLNTIKSLIFKPKLSQEALEAYWYKLPQKIEVEWFRDGKYIIGRIKADNHEFMTQALSAAEFVEMVNDALFAVYEIPREYFNILEPRKFIPDEEQFKRLNNLAIEKSNLDFQKVKALA
ncbi:MAG: hypothetical protein V1692_00675 [bacterium]